MGPGARGAGSLGPCPSSSISSLMTLHQAFPRVGTREIQTQELAPSLFYKVSTLLAVWTWRPSTPGPEVTV